MRIRARHLRVAWAAAFFVLLGLAGTFSASAARNPKHQPGPPDAPPGSSKPQSGVTYSGRAYAAFVNVPTLGIGPTFVSDTGELPSNGGFQSEELVDVTVPGVLSAQLLVARTSGANGVAESSASLAEVNVLNGLVTAGFVRAESEATCNGVRGSTEILQLMLAGAEIAVDPFAPNQMVGPVEVVGVGTVTISINEQVANTGPGFREIAVNAVHVIVTGLVEAEVILSHAESDIRGCPGCPPTPACHDFVTGGGFITVGTSRANFGFNAGFKARATVPEGHLNYIDHNTGMHVKATSVTVYVEGISKTSRHIEGEAEVNGVPGFTYKVDVADNGEPGRSTDTFSISLSSGYREGGTLAGGNIQLHKPCP
jgi:hypothetical protein